MGNILKKKYLNNIQNIMRDLSKKNKSIFIGQSVSYPGNLIYKSLLKVPNSKKFDSLSKKKLINRKKYSKILKC